MYHGSRGVVGLVKPTYRPGMLESFIRLMPEGVGVVPTHVGVRAGTEQEFLELLATIERKVANIASRGVDMVLIAGAPPVALRGGGADYALAKKLEERHGLPVVTATMAQIEAFRALGVHRIVGITYFGDELNEKFATFFRESGFEVAAMRGYDMPFGEVQKIPPGEIYALARRAFLEAEGADGIYMLGAGWDPLPVVQILEDDLAVPVVASVPAQVWAAQKRLRIRAPVAGYGRLLAEMP